MDKLHPGARWLFRLRAYYPLLFIGLFVSIYSFQILSTSSGDANIDKKIKEAYDEYEKQMQQLEENWQKGEGKQILDERTEKIGDFKNADAWKSLSLPKIGTAVVAGALIAGVAVPALAGAFGSTGIAIASGIQTLGIGALTLSVGTTAVNLINERDKGTLTKDRLMSIVGPQIVLIGAIAIGGAVGGSIGIVKFKKPPLTISAVATKSKGLLYIIEPSKGLSRRIHA